MEITIELKDPQFLLLGNLFEVAKLTALKAKMKGDSNPLIEEMLTLDIKEFSSQLLVHAIQELAITIRNYNEPCPCVVCSQDIESTVNIQSLD